MCCLELKRCRVLQLRLRWLTTPARGVVVIAFYAPSRSVVLCGISDGVSGVSWWLCVSVRICVRGGVGVVCLVGIGGVGWVSGSGVCVVPSWGYPVGSL